MFTIKFLITITAILFSIKFLFVGFINKILEKRGLNVLFSVSGPLSLKYLKLNIENKYLLRYNICDLEILICDVYLRIKSWKLKISVGSFSLKFNILNEPYNKEITLNNNQNLNNSKNVGIIRNLMLIVVIQIISRIIYIDIHNIDVATVLSDSNYGKQVLDNNISGNNEKEMRYGITLNLLITSLFISTKTYIGGIMLNLRLNHFYFLVFPIENTMSYKRCNASYIDFNGKLDTQKINSKDNDRVLKYILGQFKTNIHNSKKGTIIEFPPLFYVKDEMNIDIRMMHSISGSDIKICSLKSMSICTNKLWITIVMEVICELIYILDIYSHYKSDTIVENRNKNLLSDKDDFQNKKLPDSEVTEDVNFNNIIDNNKNSNFYGKVKVNCNILTSILIFCDNTSTSSGFELIFDEFESNLTIKYYKEYCLKNKITDIDSDEFDDEFVNEIENMSYSEINFNRGNVSYDKCGKSKRISKSFKLIMLSRVVTGNSIFRSNGDKYNTFLTSTSELCKNSIKDDYIVFERMFIVDKYKSLLELSNRNSIKLYFHNSVQKLFGIWKESGFYHNLSLFLQLIKFRKYLLKIKNGQFTEYIENEKDEFTNDIPNIPIRVELDKNDKLNSGFAIEDNMKLLELKNSINTTVGLLFYFDIKDLVIQTNNINFSNNLLFDLKSKYDITNNYCKNCVVDSFGPNERYNWKIINDYCGNNLNNEDQHFALVIKQLKMCNTSLNRNFSMFFRELKLISLNDFIDLENISFNYFTKLINIDEHCNNHICIHKYGCFNQKIKYFRYEKFDHFKKSDLYLSKAKEILINIPWDCKKILIKVTDLNGDLSLSYVPIYLYLLSCFSMDSISLKNNNLHSIYFGVNNKFEENMDYYINKKCDYYNNFIKLKNEFVKLISNVNTLEVLNRSIHDWSIPDMILSKNGQKYTWYFCFEDININFSKDFKLTVKYLSLNRCNEYGNYDILINDLNIADPRNNNILYSEKVRLRSDTPFKSKRIKSPICLKKQLRRLLDLSINGDLLLLSILGDQGNIQNNLCDINNGFIYFDSKRFILEIDGFKLLLFNNIYYMEPLFEYIYRYVYITFYQLFHPPIIIRLNKLLSYSRKHPIIFSCNNIFDFNIKNCSVHVYDLNNLLFPSNNNNIIKNNNILFYKDDICIYNTEKNNVKCMYNYKSIDGYDKWKMIVNSNNMFNTPIIDINFDLFKIHIRTKHTPNTISNCDQKECYNIPNYLISKCDNSNTIINSDHNPFNLFGYANNLIINMYNSIRDMYNNTLYTRNEFNMNVECLFFDIRRTYTDLKDVIENKKMIGSYLNISIHSNNKLTFKISNVHSFKLFKKLLHIFEVIKGGNKFKYRNINEIKNQYVNTIINKKAINISVNINKQTLISLSPYEKDVTNMSKFIDNNSSVEIIFKKINYTLHIESNFNSFYKSVLNIQNGLIISLNFFKYNNIPTFNKEYMTKYKIVHFSELTLKYYSNVGSDTNIKVSINGIDRESFMSKNVCSNSSNSILTIDMNNEKISMISEVINLFFDYDNFHNISMYYCTVCMKYKYINKMIDNKNDNYKAIDMLFDRFNYNVYIVLDYFQIKYEFLGLTINKAILNLYNNKLKGFKFNLSEILFFVEANPLKYDTFLINKINNNIQLTSIFNYKTKVMDFLYIGKIIVNIDLSKDIKTDNNILIIDSIKLSLNMLLIMYVDALMKIVNCKTKSKDRKNDVNVDMLNNLNLNIQINNLLVNIFTYNRDTNTNTRVTGSKIFKRNSKIINEILNIDDIDNILLSTLVKNPVYNTIKIAEEYFDCNETMKIFCLNKLDCIECKYKMNKILLYSSCIKIEDYYKNHLIYLNNYLRRYMCYNSFNKSIFNIYNEYRKINMYNDNYSNHTIEYEHLIMNLFDCTNSGFISYNKNNDCDYDGSANVFRQTILNIKNINFILSLKESNKVELLLKMLPLSIYTAVSNNLILYSFENNTNEMVHSNSIQYKNIEFNPNLMEYNEYDNKSVNDNQCLVKSNEYQLDDRNICTESDQCEDDKVIIDDYYENDSNNHVYELLKTEPVFINFHMNLRKYNKNIKMYCDSLLLSIDSNRVQIINDIISSFEYKKTAYKHNNASFFNHCNNPNVLLSVASSNMSFSNNNLTSTAAPNMDVINGTSLPPTIYYSHNDPLNNTTYDYSSCFNNDNASFNAENSNGVCNLNNNTSIIGNANTYSTFRTPSSVSFSSYVNESSNNIKNNNGNINNENNIKNDINNSNVRTSIVDKVSYHRVSILSMLSIDFEKQKDYINKRNTDSNINKFQLIEVINEKNINNILKSEIDRYLLNNPLSYTMVDNIQIQQNCDNDNAAVVNNNIQIECIIDKLNVDMFIDKKMFSNFQSTEINIVLLSNKQKDVSTIIEFDASSINLIANRDFFYNSDNNGSSQYNINPSSNINSNNNNNDFVANNNINFEERIPIIYPMYIDGHTNQGHGHVLSIRINMRQIKLLDLFDIRILESVIIRVNPIKVNITQYLTSCYYDIFFKTHNDVVNNLSINSNNNYDYNNNNNDEYYDNENHNNCSYNIHNCENTKNVCSTSHHHNNLSVTGCNNNSINDTNNNHNHNSISLVNSDITEKKILYFNYLRISSILAEVTYRGSVSLNKVLFELGSFTQRRKCRTIKEMIDKYLSFLRRQAARPVISHTFKQIKQSLLPKHFKSLKKNNYNTHYNYLYNDNQSNCNSNNIHSLSINYNASQTDFIDLNYGSETNNNEEKEYYNNNYLNNDLFNNNNAGNVNKINHNSSSRIDTEYNKFRLLFGNQLLF